VQLVVILAAARRPVPPTAPLSGGVESLGTRLFTDYLFPFELTSVLLLAAMVGVLVLARRRPS
jgi:NADH-quinone oxidoreductase subunit J